MNTPTHNRIGPQRVFTFCPRRRRTPIQRVRRAWQMFGSGGLLFIAVGIMVSVCALGSALIFYLLQ